MTNSYRLIIPPAARPVTLWSQSVQIGSTLTTSNAYRLKVLLADLRRGAARI